MSDSTGTGPSPPYKFDMSTSSLIQDVRYFYINPLYNLLVSKVFLGSIVDNKVTMVFDMYIRSLWL